MKKILLLTTFALLIVLLTNAHVVLADDPEPQAESSATYCAPDIECAESMPPAVRARGGQVDRIAAAAERKGREALLAKGGPDAFGYKWNDGVPFNWIDATNGTDTGMSGNSWGQKTGGIKLPFQFPYYENRYKKIWIAASGYIAFTDPGYARGQTRVPDPTSPNNIIAAYSSYFDLSSGGKSGRVFYKKGGTAPNRYFVIQWNQVKSFPPYSNAYTFEIILHENGDIVVQYQNMQFSGYYWCGASGIENSLGLVGLTYKPYCSVVPSNKAVRYTRPPASARVRYEPGFVGKFVAPNELAEYSIAIRNIGDLGTDTFDITVASAYNTTLFMADGITPLADTDSDTIPDTGPVEQGKAVNIVAKVQTPGDAATGDWNQANLTATSTINPAVSAVGQLQGALAANYVQAFSDYANGTVNLDLVQNSMQSIIPVTANDYFGYDTGVTTQPNSNRLSTWGHGRCLNANCNPYVEELEFSLRDPSGNPVTGIKKLRNLGGASKTTYDYNYGASTAPNGSTGIAFVEEIYDENTGRWNDNILFAQVKPTGKGTAAKNLTNNTGFRDGDDYHIPTMYGARIAALDNNNYFIVWTQENWRADIWFAIVNAKGNLVKPPTNLTNSPAGVGYYNSTVLPLADGNVLIAFNGYDSSKQRFDIYYAVRSKTGSQVKKVTNLTKDTVMDGYGLDAAQLNNGNILLAWNTYSTTTQPPTLRYAMLNNSFQTVLGSTQMDNPAGATGNSYPSLTSDANGNAIMSWQDAILRRNLYYALFDENGTLKTPATIFRTSISTLQSSFSGIGNSKY